MISMISMISMIASLAEELDALVDLPPLRLLLWFSFSIGLVWSLAVGLPLGIRIAWQLGLDPRRRLVLASSLSRASSGGSSLMHSAPWPASRRSQSRTARCGSSAETHRVSRSRLRRHASWMRWLIGSAPPSSSEPTGGLGRPIRR